LATWGSGMNSSGPFASAANDSFLAVMICGLPR
jgi:hypothetical protein